MKAVSLTIAFDIWISVDKRRHQNKGDITTLCRQRPPIYDYSGTFRNINEQSYGIFLKA